MPVPAIVAIDLDDTIWSPEMYLSSGSPFKKEDGIVYGSAGEKIEFLGDSQEVLKSLSQQDCKIVYVSRTDYPEWANEVIQLMELTTELTMQDVGDQSLHQIYPGDKKVS